MYFNLLFIALTDNAFYINMNLRATEHLTKPLSTELPENPLSSITMLLIGQRWKLTPCWLAFSTTIVWWRCVQHIELENTAKADRCICYSLAKLKLITMRLCFLLFLVLAFLASLGGSREKDVIATTPAWKSCALWVVVVSSNNLNK